MTDERQHFGRFALDGVLGVGGMGVVHTATDTRLGRRVALKLMSGPLAQHPEFRERFLREAAVLTRLDSPHVVQVYDHGDQDGTLWIATPFLAGGDLAALVRRRGPLPGALAAELCRQVADGLAVAHSAGVVHRDVKPANVLLRDAEAARLEAVVCDFGVASTGLGGLTATGAVAGTFEYLAPEYGEGAPPSPAGDVYALGCLLWACLTGRPPYTGSAVDVARGHRDGALPRLVGRDPWVRRLNDVLARCLAKRPADRFADAATARDALAEVARSAPASGPLAGPLQAAPATPALPPAPERGATARRRRRGALTAGGAALVLVAGGLAALALTSGADDDGPDSEAAESTTTLPPVEPAVRGDVTGDGLGDLVVRDWDPQPGRTVVLPSDGAGFGTPAVVLENVFLPVTGDVDGDGAEEVVSVGVPTETLTVTVTSVAADGRPDDVIEHEIPLAEGERDIGTPVLADLNGDGRADLVVTSTQGASGGRLAVWAALSTGDGFGELRPLFDEERRFELVAAADVDGDGVDELVVVADDSLEVLTPDAEVTELATEGPTAINGYLFNPAVGDFDGDGAAEVAVVAGGANDAIALYRWDGTAWSDEFWLDDGGDAIDLSKPNPSTGVVDADGDGIDDLVRFQRAEEAGEDEDVVWLLRGGPDGFGAPERWASYTCECDQFYDPTGSYAG